MAALSSGKFYSMLPVEVPKNLTRGTLSTAPLGTRVEVAIRPQVSGTYTPSQFQLIFTIPVNGIYDFSRGKFQLTGSCSQTGGTYCRFPKGIWQAINRILIQSSTKTIEDFRNYNQWAACFYEMVREPKIDAIYGPSWGIGSVAARNQWASGYTYSIPLFNGFFTLPPLNMNPMNGISELITITIYFDQPQVFFENDGTSPTYTFSSPLLYLDLLTIDDPKARALVSTRGSKWKITTSTMYPTATLTQQNFTITVNHRCQSLMAMVGIMQTTGNYNLGTVNNKLNTFNYNSCTNFQAQINSVFYPQEPIDAVGPDAWLNYLDLWGMWSFNGVFKNPPTVALDMFQFNKFFMVLDLECWPTYRNMINPVGLADAGTQFNIYVNLGSAPSSNQTFVLFVMYDMIVVVDNNGWMTSYM